MLGKEQSRRRRGGRGRKLYLKAMTTLCNVETEGGEATTLPVSTYLLALTMGNEGLGVTYYTYSSTVQKENLGKRHYEERKGGN